MASNPRGEVASATGSQLRRRGLVAGLAAVVTAGLVKASERIAAAAGNGSPIIMGNNDSTTNNPNETTQLVRAANANTHDAFIVANQSGNAIVGSSLNAFTGVLGVGAANGIGVAGHVGTGFTFAPTNVGVHGQVAANAAPPLTNPGLGVRGDSQISAGVFGVSTSGSPAAINPPSGGIGVAGFSPGGVGIRGDSSANPPVINPRIGVLGVADQNALALAAPVQAAAVYGLSNSEIAGVVGQSNSGVGVQGASNGNVGVLGQSNGSVAVFASSATSTGVYATSGSGTAIVASTNNGNAIQGASNGNVGVLGSSNSSIGGFFTSATSTGLFASGPAFGFAARFDGPVQVTGAFTVIGGPKSAAVPHPDGSHRRLYCVESPESWFEDFGEDQLVNGRARVRLDADFNALVRGDRYQVFLTPEGDCNGLYVSTKSANGFEVRELKGGSSTLAFGYRVVAKRRDIAGPRLEKVDLPGVPPLPVPPAPPAVPPAPPAPTMSRDQPVSPPARPQRG